ncbi:MAG: phage holin family protein [Bacteroidales bacterium]|nr:phage holin family protein [Bacteroidales bacterium]
MNDMIQLFELLWKRAVDYGKTNMELIKLRLLNSVLDLFSSLIPPVILFFIVGFFLLFLSFGLALWLSEILGNVYLGFLIVAIIYGIAAMIVHLFLHKRIKKVVSDYIIKQIFK